MFRQRISLRRLMLGVATATFLLIPSLWTQCRASDPGLNALGSATLGAEPASILEIDEVHELLIDSFSADVDGVVRHPSLRIRHWTRHKSSQRSFFVSTTRNSLHIHLVRSSSARSAWPVRGFVANTLTPHEQAIFAFACLVERSDHSPSASQLQRWKC